MISYSCIHFGWYNCKTAVQTMTVSSVIWAQGAYLRSGLATHPVSLMALPFWRDDIVSDHNLMAFLRFLQLHPNQLKHVRELYVIEHKDPMECIFGATPIPSVTLDGEEFSLPSRSCTKDGCQRCGTQGGFRFGWFSPQWSCLTAQGLMPDEARARWNDCAAKGGCVACRSSTGRK